VAFGGFEHLKNHGKDRFLVETNFSTILVAFGREKWLLVAYSQESLLPRMQKPAIAENDFQ
jgi:hypothetical protein